MAVPLAGHTGGSDTGEKGIPPWLRTSTASRTREGADVLISYLPEEEKDAQETVRLVRDAGRTAVTVPGDIREEAHCQRIVDRAVAEFGRIDALVNNAAHQMMQPGAT
ncbi:SDR family oxidoreductase [Planosporangium flavigriseum]|uniref:Short chain dehydrogenase n=1 Tax=Planosporangium flavigriseum TaxID=373681 RepID=A0A8J3LJ70_9ACTN|nr:hypothetical protein Pfl04_11310 [Planosporangium flavigriseum]